MKVVVFVDVQNDFIDGILRNQKAIDVTPEIVEFAKACISNGYKIYATRDTHEKTEYSGFYPDSETGMPKRAHIVGGYMATLEGKKLPVEHCIEGTDGWMIDNRLMEVLEGKCTFVNKPTFGSFDLADIIEEDSVKTWEKVPYEKNYDIEEIVLCGFCTSICVLANAVLLRAKFPNTKITVMKDLCACVSEESHNAALKAMEMQQIDIV